MNTEFMLCTGEGCLKREKCQRYVKEPTADDECFAVAPVVNAFCSEFILVVENKNVLDKDN